jgi:hypothetical protein
LGEAVVIHLTPQARTELRDDEALVFDWHRVAICCACAGEVSLRHRSDLPPDFGLRAVFGRAEPTSGGNS